MEHLARLTARVLQASGAVIALPTSLSAGAEDVEVAGSWPPGRPTALPALAYFLRRAARGDEIVMTDAGAVMPAVAEGCPACVGVPLRGADGVLLGVLAAFDVRTRSWTSQDLRDLEDLAHACVAELRLSAGRQPRTRRRDARQPRPAAANGSGPTPGEAQELRSRLERSELLLRAAELLADTSGVAEVRSTVSDLVSGDLKPAYVGLVLREDDAALRRAVDATRSPVPLEDVLPRYDLSAAWPSAQAARENRIVSVPDRLTLISSYDPQTVAVFDAMGLSSAICVPLPGTRRPTLGTLIVAWNEAHEIGLHERTMLTAIAGYTAHAVERALYLDERIGVARQLQRAMLTDLPHTPGLELAALYRPAASDDMVGGDWYDAYPLPDARPGVAGRAPLAVTVGDVTGHNMRAAALMGQVRSMLRQADIDQADSPAAAVAAVERANEHLRTGISGTLVHAHLLPRPHGRWLLRWTNAGHPAPLLAHPEHGVESLTEHARLLFPGLAPADGRPVHERLLDPGSVLLLYTDGLVEHPGRDFDEVTDRAACLLAQATCQNTPLPPLLNLLADTLAGHEHRDDIVLFALRVRGEE
ncbi:SpoIIE family protein phosphatase [Streptomyces seoulensis]|uniref:SpoIIE family protein phosphatase n=1 Tax=Streptomyces seoulensis TaxID=73044 RepID=UPI003C30063A